MVVADYDARAPANAAHECPFTNVSVTASDIDLFGDRFAGGWILSEPKSMQELVNHDDFGRRAIPLKRMSELLSAHANEPGPGPCERQRPRAAALPGPAVIEEPQRSERIGRRLFSDLFI